MERAMEQALGHILGKCRARNLAPNWCCREMSKKLASSKTLGLASKPGRAAREVLLCTWACWPGRKEALLAASLAVGSLRPG